MKTLLVIDGNSMLNRAFYGIRPLSTKDGLPTNAIYGFINILKKHIDNYKPDYQICTFDVHAPTFRHKMYDAYKGTRKGMPEDLAKQFSYAKEAAALLGFYIAECPGYEADDEIGTICYEADKLGDIQSYIVTGDRDSLQLISDRTSVNLVKTKGDIVYNRTIFHDEYGVWPEQFVDVKSLMGDSSDNIPGVPGIGEKTAFKLIQDYSSLDNIYEQIDDIKVSQSVKEKLISNKEKAYLSKELALICRSAPCINNFDDFKTQKIDTNKLKEFLIKLEFNALINKFNLNEEGSTLESFEDTQTSLIIPDVLESNTDVLKIDTPAISLDENNIYVSDGTNIYKLNYDIDTLKQLTIKPFVCHNFKKICKLSKLDIEYNNCIFDTMLASYLLQPGKSTYPIDKIALSYLAISKESYTLSDEAFIVANSWQKLKADLEKENMLHLLNTIEIPLSKVLASMEITGFTIDCEKIKDYSSQLKVMMEGLASQIYMQAGCEFNINSPKQLGDILVNKIGITSLTKTKSGGYSTDADTLKWLKGSYQIVADILDYRQVSKLISTYGDTLWKLVDENNRIHTTFNQTGTATGRLSSSDPNLQNIPTRGELGKEFRKFFIPQNEDYVLIDADYSQIELRLMAELSQDKKMIEAFSSGEDIHRTTASQVFNLPIEEVTPDLRRRAKAVNFGIIYGIGPYTLSQDLEISLKQAKQYISNYLATFSSVDSYLKETVASAKSLGYTTTLYGRKRFIPELKGTNKILINFGERVAMNSPIQGSAADIIKVAMINTYNKLKEANIDAKLLLQVHDELIIEAKRSDAELAAKILKETMENVLKTTVKLETELGIGDTWFDAH